MRKKLSYLYNYFILSRKLRRSRKKRGALSFRVASAKDFLNDLDGSGVRYVVLRWPDKFPAGRFPKDTDISQVDEEFGDVDILIELGEGGRKHLLQIGARHFSPSGVIFEFYSTHGAGGFCYKRFPYYPPVMARQLLAQRFFDPRGFYRLIGEPYITSLTYHVLYHKAAATCASDAPSEEAKVGEYLQRLQAEAVREKVSLPAQVTLGALQYWLAQRGQDMPFDLKTRWPRNAGWLGMLVRRESEQFGLLHPPGFNYFCIFILRDDLEKAGLLDQARASIGIKFDIKQVIEVPPEHRLALAARLRGGNWMEGSRGEEIMPCTFLVCDDPSPELLEKPMLGYPHLDNAKLRWKKDLRDEMSKLAGKRLYAVHSSDNCIEAIAILKVLKDQGLVD